MGVKSGAWSCEFLIHLYITLDAKLPTKERCTDCMLWQITMRQAHVIIHN